MKKESAIQNNKEGLEFVYNTNTLNIFQIGSNFAFDYITSIQKQDI